MQFLIDYENVHNLGLRGAELLTRDDGIIIYYSQSCNTIEKGALQRIISSGCTFQIEKLKNIGRNALDFYIATQVGEFYGQGSGEIVGIVSGDKGLKALRDFWLTRKRNVIVKPSIIQCIISANEMTERTKAAHGEMDVLNLEEEYKAYRAAQERIQRLRNIVDGDVNVAEYVIAQIAEGCSPRELYLYMLKTFGRVRGTEAYRGVKAWREEERETI